MKTIEERTLNLYELNRPDDAMDAPVEEAYANGLKDGYIKGAKEQLKIDRKEFAFILDKACLLVEFKYNMNTLGFLYERIIKAMKEVYREKIKKCE